jgi:TonB family protein
MKKLMMCAALLLAPVAALGATDLPPDLAGPYQSSDGQQLVLTQVSPGTFKVVGDRWEGVGTFDGTHYKGVFRRTDAIGPGVAGTHTGVLLPGGMISVHAVYKASGRSYDMVWTRVSPLTLLMPPADDAPDPKFGDPVYFDTLPQVAHKVPASYRDLVHGVEGLVGIQALVGKDGRVKDTRVVQSVPMLDQAAVVAVRQWEFKPATANGRPIAMWTPVSVRFTAQ